MTSGPDVAQNLAQAAALIEEAAARGARLVALPENFSFMGLRDADKRAVAEADGGGPVQDFLAATARAPEAVAHRAARYRCAPAPTGASPPPRWCTTRTGAAWPATTRFTCSTWTFPGAAESYRESAHVAPGSRAVVIDTPVGRLGLSVCYDVRFPELYRHLSAAGAQLLVVPSAFTSPTGRAHWETLLRARAIENLCYVIAPAQSGFHPSGRETYGDSMIVDYWGRVLQRVPRGTGCAVAEIDLQRQSGVRDSFPALVHRVFCRGKPCP